MTTARAAIGAGTLLLLSLLGLIVLVGAQEEQNEQAAASTCGGGSVQVSGVPDQLAAGGADYTREQLENAAAVIRAGADQGLDVHGQTVGVMTAIGESSLINVDYGDAVGPDSRGLFQQRDNGAWGTYADRMDPYTAATNFYKALVKVPGWETLPPTIAAHDTQHNADPYHYERFWDDAVAIVGALSGADVTVLTSSTGGTSVSCTPAVAGGPVAASGWTNPVPGATFTSGFGGRWGTTHYGVDLAAPLGTPIHAAAAGTVIDAGPASGFGQWIRIDHGGGVITVYGHMFPEDLLVHVGDQVAAGQQIARVGSAGQSTGPHCHFEVHINGVKSDPEPFMSERGVPLR